MLACRLALRQFSKIPLCFGLLLAIFDIVHPAHLGQEQAKSKQSEIQRRPNIELYCHTIRWEPGWPKRTLVAIHFLRVSNIILNTTDQKTILKGNYRCTVRCADCVPSGLCLSGKDRFVSCSSQTVGFQGSTWNLFYMHNVALSMYYQGTPME